MTAKNTLLAAAMFAALFAATPAFAQDSTESTDTPETTVEETGVTKDRLVDEYGAALFDGDEVAAADAVTALRTGGDFTVVTTGTRQVTNPDGSLPPTPTGRPKWKP